MRLNIHWNFYSFGFSLKPWVYVGLHFGPWTIYWQREVPVIITVDSEGNARAEPL
jgi:hypothetical protein